MIRFEEHFQRKTRFETVVNSASFVAGFSLSTFFTKQRTHNLAIGGLSYIAATKAMEFAEQKRAIPENKDSLLKLTTAEYIFLQRQLSPF